MRKKQSITLYNILFPVWLLAWIPSPLWLLLIPLNFVIDYIVLYKSLPDDTERGKSVSDGGQGNKSRPDDTARSKSFPDGMQRKAFCNKHTWKICAAGFAADFIGSLFLLASFIITSSHKPDSLQAINHGLGLNPFENAAAFLIVVCAIILAAYCIYRFDSYLLKRAGLSEEQGRKSALWLAVVTAPYLFLLPSEILYR